MPTLAEEIRPGLLCQCHPLHSCGKHGVNRSCYRTATKLVAVPWVEKAVPMCAECGARHDAVREDATK